MCMVTHMKSDHQARTITGIYNARVGFCACWDADHARSRRFCDTLKYD